MFLFLVELTQDIIDRERRYNLIRVEEFVLSTGRAIALDEILTFVGTVLVGIILTVFFLTEARDHFYIFFGICVLFIGLFVMSVKGILGICRRRRAYTDYLATDVYQEYLRYQNSAERLAAQRALAEYYEDYPVQH